MQYGIRNSKGRVIGIPLLIFVYCVFVSEVSNSSQQDTQNAILNSLFRNTLSVGEFWKNQKKPFKDTLEKCTFESRIDEPPGKVVGVRISDNITLLALVEDGDGTRTEVTMEEIEFAHTWLSLRYAEWNDGFDVQWPGGPKRIMTSDGKIKQ